MDVEVDGGRWSGRGGSQCNFCQCKSNYIIKNVVYLIYFN